MITIRIAGPNFDALVELVESMSHPNLMPLANAIKPIMIADNANGLMAGLDCNGNPMVPVRESTIKRGRGGDGPPLNPKESSSRIISGYDVDIQELSDRILLVGNWQDPWVHFHGNGGTKFMAERNPIGIRPNGMAQIEQTVRDFAIAFVGGQS